MMKPLTHLTCILSLCACTATKDTATETTPDNHWTLHPLSVSADGKIVDPDSNQVLLRGVNITSLGEYWQGSSEHPPTLPTTEADIQEMASRGLSVIRLIVHWSRIEPQRGVIDQAYLDQVDDLVTLAASYGIYSVIDMHQDAYSAFIYTAADEICPEGTTPGKGWDGAPEWATLTDGLSTCIHGERNSAPAVLAAWNHFYDNTDGIQDRFVESWRAVAQRFAGRPEVAGYDLLNEPETSRPVADLLPLYENMLVKVIAAIQDAEAAADFQHLLFIEPTIPAGDRDLGLGLPDPERMGVAELSIVNATHNYSESIDFSGLSLEQTNSLLVGLAQNQGTALWLGEYGFWSTDPDTLAVAQRFAADEDRHGLGGAWWQWRQPCGDPHSLHLVDDAWVPHADVTHLHAFDCSTGTDLGPTEEFLRLLGRGYPRVVAGRISALVSDPHTRELSLEGQASAAGQRLVLWTPTTDDSHSITTTGIDQLLLTEVAGGRYVTGVAAGAGHYSVLVTLNPE